MRQVWKIIIWTWNGEGNEPETHQFFNEMIAKAAFRAIQVSKDTPQIDLYECLVNKYEQVVDKKLIGRKD